MAKSLNRIMLIGNLGKDPEVRTTPAGANMAAFTICTELKWKDKSKKEWHNVVCWRKMADLAENYLQKGDQVYIDGRLETRKWKGRDGQERTTVEVIVQNIVMMGSSEDREYGSGRTTNGEGEDGGRLPSDDDIPF